MERLNEGLARETPYLECGKTPTVANKMAPSFAYVKDKLKLEFGISRCVSQKTPENKKPKLLSKNQAAGFQVGGCVLSAGAELVLFPVELTSAMATRDHTGADSPRLAAQPGRSL